MAYDKQIWVDDDGTLTVGTVVTADRMNHMEQGIEDASVVWRGDWDPEADYAVNDLAFYGGSTFRALEAIVGGANPEPVNDGARWAYVAQVGADGLPGPQGAQGDPGPQGDPGEPPDWEGAWSPDTAYVPNQIVLYQGSAYLTRGGAPANEPPTDGGPFDAYWTLIVSKGADGAPGDVGPAGADGAPGAKGDTGDTGPQGDPGPPPFFYGPWSPDISYSVGDLVQYGGQTFSSRGDPALNNPPTTGDETDVYWMLVAAKGADGAQGPQGDVGPAGAQGVAPPVIAAYLTKTVATALIATGNTRQVPIGNGAVDAFTFSADGATAFRYNQADESLTILVDGWYSIAAVMKASVNLGAFDSTRKITPALVTTAADALLTGGDTTGIPAIVDVPVPPYGGRSVPLNVIRFLPAGTRIFGSINNNSGANTTATITYFGIKAG